MTVQWAALNIDERLFRGGEGDKGAAEREKRPLDDEAGRGVRRCRRDAWTVDGQWSLLRSEPEDECGDEGLTGKKEEQRYDTDPLLEGEGAGGHDT